MSPAFLDLHVRLRRLLPEDAWVLRGELQRARDGTGSPERASYVLAWVLARLPREARSASERRVDVLLSLLAYCGGTTREARALGLLCGIPWRQANARAVEEALVALGPGIAPQLVDKLEPREPMLPRATFEACLGALVRFDEVSAVPVIVANLRVRQRGHQAMLVALEKLTAGHADLRDKVLEMVKACASPANPALEQQLWPSLARGKMTSFRLGLIRARYRRALGRFRARDRAKPLRTGTRRPDARG